MALVLPRQNQPDFEPFRITFSNVEKILIARDKSNSDELQFQYPLERDVKYGTKDSQFDVYLFHKDNFAANDIFQISIQNKRLGWLFPIQALLTSQHDYAASEHFFPYSFNAYKILIKNKTNLPYKTINYDEFSSIEDIYGENTFVFIVYKKYVKDIKRDLNIDFQITNYLLFLYQHGYTYLTSNNFSSLFEIKSTTPTHKSFTGSTVELISLFDGLLDGILYLNSLVQGLIKLEKHPLVKFHLLYSVIELFISKIFESEFKANINAFLTAADFYDSKEKLGKLANEKERINKLF